MKRAGGATKTVLVTLCLTVSLSLSFAANALDSGGQPGLLGSWEFGSARMDALPLWRDVLLRMDQERDQIAKCDRDVRTCVSPSMIAWRAKIKELQSVPLRQRVQAVNRFINSWPRRSDPDAHGKADHWATPLEFLDRSGDAEDFAVMKFATLRETGLKNDQLRIVLAKDTLSDRADTIVAAYIDGEILILSTQWTTVIRDTHATAYVPFISANETSRWVHVPLAEIRLNTENHTK